MSLRKELSRYPFIRILFFLIIGIIAGDLFSFSWQMILCFGVLGLLGMIFYAGIPFLRDNYHWQGGFGIALAFTLFALGAGLVYEANYRMKYSYELDVKTPMLAIIDEIPKVKPNSVQTVLRIKAVRREGDWDKTDLRILGYFQKDTLSKEIGLGDVLMLSSRIQRITNRGNPYEFDYARYMRNQHVLYSTYLKSNAWKRGGIASKFSLKRISHNWRRKLLNIYSEYDITQDAYGVLAALTLGYRDAISHETRETWASAGAMHVLAVSGLHVGIIYIVLNSLLRFFNRIRWGKYFRGILILLMLWLYAFLTGLSPSVMRATTMFTFVVVGQFFNRAGTIYNSLAASAFLLLLTDPFLLFAVGFQLSYLAVLAIVFFQPKIYWLWTPTNRLVDKVWALTSVSLAAQLGTFPLGMFYFHQFPNYFLLTNLIVIPSAAILIYLVLGLFIVAKIPVIAKLLAWMIKMVYQLMAGGVYLVKELPGAVWENIQLNGLQVGGIYLILILGSLLILLKRSKLLFAILGILLLIQIPIVFGKYWQRKTVQVTVYNIKGHSVCSIVEGQNAFLMLDSLCEMKFVDRVVAPHTLSQGVRITKSLRWNEIDSVTSLFGSIDLRTPFCLVGKSCFAFVADDYWNNIQLEVPVQIDYLVIGNNFVGVPADILKIFSPQTIIIDPSISYRSRRLWKRYQYSDSIQIFDVLKQGAFTFQSKI
ncbi:MAG: ComEC/Rec2 family competence protein [Marinifilaceae bacterium]